MKTQEKNFDGIKLSGFTAILIMLALTGTAIYLLSLPQTPSIIAGVICGICVVVMLPGFMIIQPNNSSRWAASIDTERCPDNQRATEYATPPTARVEMKDGTMNRVVTKPANAPSNAPARTQRAATHAPIEARKTVATTVTIFAMD